MTLQQMLQWDAGWLKEREVAGGRSECLVSCWRMLSDGTKRLFSASGRMRRMPGKKRDSDR